MHIGQLYPYWIHIVPILVTGSILYTYWTIVPILDDCTHIGPILYPYCTHNGSILDPYWSLFIPRQGWGPLVLLLVETSRRHSQTAQSGRGPWSEMEVKLKTQTFQKRTRNESTWHHGEGKRQRARSEECKSTQPGHSAQGLAGNFSVGYFFLLSFDFTWKPFISHFKLWTCPETSSKFWLTDFTFHITFQLWTSP